MTSFVGCLDEESKDKEGPKNAIYDMFESIGNNDWEAFCQSVGAELDWETEDVVINQDAVDECINEDKVFEIKFTIKEYTQELQSDTSVEGDVYYVTIVYDSCLKEEEDSPTECEYDIEIDGLWMKVDGTWVDVSYLPWRDNSEEDSSDNDDESSYSITTDSLEEVFNSMNEDGEYYYTEDEWVIHDISEIVEIDGMLMFGVTGKSQEDGYTCGLETWYIFPGESEFTPGQCLLSEKPAWHSEHVPSNDGAQWAPNFHGNRTMYYTLPTSVIDGEEDTKSCIGMVTATGTAPDLVWTDHGEPIICQLEGEDNDEDPEPPALDPAIFIDDDGRMYMVYGGAHIWITELDPETGEHISGDPLSWDNGDNGDYVHLANGAEDDPLYTEDGQDPWAEAPYLHKEGDYYYLFVNWYSCCAGADSTYEIVVGRSESVTGPYLDESGTDLKDFGGTLVIAHESHDVIGPGHAGIFEYGTGNNTTQVFTHHYYPDDGEPWAYAHARTLTWENGWPVVSQELWDPSDYWENSV